MEATEDARPPYATVRRHDIESGVVGVREERQRSCGGARSDPRVDLAVRVLLDGNAERAELGGDRAHRAVFVIRSRRCRRDVLNGAERDIGVGQARHRGRGYRHARCSPCTTRGGGASCRSDRGPGR